MPLNRRSALLAGRHGAAAARVRIGRHRAMNPEPGGNTIQLPNRVNGLQQDPARTGGSAAIPVQSAKARGMERLLSGEQRGISSRSRGSVPGPSPDWGTAPCQPGRLFGISAEYSVERQPCLTSLARIWRYRCGGAPYFFLNPAREMAAVREAAFERDFGDAPRRVQQSPA